MKRRRGAQAIALVLLIVVAIVITGLLLLSRGTRGSNEGPIVNRNGAKQSGEADTPLSSPESGKRTDRKSTRLNSSHRP